MRNYVYVLKNDVKHDLTVVRNRIDYILIKNDDLGFLDVSSLSLFPCLFRLYSHLWMKKSSDLFKKKYLSIDPEQFLSYEKKEKDKL